MAARRVAIRAMVRTPLLLPVAALLLAGCHATLNGNATAEVPEATLSLVAEGSQRACSAADVQDVIARQLRPDGAGITPGPAASAVSAAQNAMRYTLDNIDLASADRGVPSVTCDAQLTASAPDYGVTAPAPVAIRYVVRPASAASDTLDVRIEGSSGRSAAQALFVQVLQRIAQRQGTQPPVNPGYEGPTTPGTAIPGQGGNVDITADNGDTPPSQPGPQPRPPSQPQPAQPPAGSAPNPGPGSGSSPGYAPSFDCATVTSETLQTVCSDRGLSRLDRRLADLYRRRVADADPEDRPGLVADERGWIADRQRCGGDADCIDQSYRDRIGELSDVDQ